MDEKEYIEERLKEQIKWYSNKSSSNQKWFKGLRVVEIIFASLIPFLSAYISSYNYLSWIVGFLGASIAIISSIQGIYKFQENWIAYRTTAESLKHELYLYQTECFPYNDSDKFCKLVNQVEHLISKENSKWQENIMKNPKAQDKVQKTS